MIVFMWFPLIRHDRSHPNIRLSSRINWDHLQWSRWSIYHNGCVHFREGYQRKAHSCAIMMAWYANFTWHLSTITNVVESRGLLQVWKLPTIFDSVQFDECVMNREHIKVKYWRLLFSTKTDFNFSCCTPHSLCTSQAQHLYSLSRLLTRSANKASYNLSRLQSCYWFSSHRQVCPGYR